MEGCGMAGQRVMRLHKIYQMDRKPNFLSYGAPLAYDLLH